MTRTRVLVVGCGNMGSSHARAYRAIPGFEICGLVSRKPDSRERLKAELGGRHPTFASFDQAFAETRPDAVSINTFPDTHAELAARSLRGGAHVFLEKPIAPTVAEARAVVDLAVATGRKLVVGYILRVHPAWIRFIELAGQQSRGADWETHKSLMASTSPLVDCGVHYVDAMCQMTRSRPVRVSAIGARLTDEIADRMYNYGQLQVTFEDGSVGWYECGWGPMMSETAYFVKDVVGPLGSVSIVDRHGERGAGSADIGSHTRTQSLKTHWSERRADGTFARADEWIDTTDEPDHDALCRREQELFLRAIREDVDLTLHLQDALESLRIVLAADESARTGRTVEL
jgi:predicted dehydrogenase